MARQAATKSMETQEWSIWSRKVDSRQEIFVPKGLQDSARGFNPGNTFKKCPALERRQIVVIDGSFG